MDYLKILILHWAFDKTCSLVFHHGQIHNSKECFENLLTKVIFVLLAALVGMECMQQALKVAFIMSWTGYVTMPATLPH